jgi:4-hydroxybenzoate polyprenyltransferase
MGRALSIAVLIFCGLALLLPGLCFLGFGLYFVGGTILSGTRDIYGFIPISLIQLVIGGLLTWGAVAVFSAIGKQPK